MLRDVDEGFNAEVHIRPEALAPDLRQRLLDALDQIHACGVLHCDIVGRNLMVSSDNQEVYILDFGCAELCSDAEPFEDEKKKLRALSRM